MTSYCAGCGGSLSAGANYCSTCGKAATELGAAGSSGPVRPAFAPLVRPHAGRKLAGVCQGLSNLYGWDVTLTRVIAVVLGVMTFPIGILVYLLMWLMVPEETRLLPATTNLNTTI